MSVLLVVLRWVARLSGLVVVGGYVSLAVGDLVNPHGAGPDTLLEWAGIALMTAACLAMLAAWRWELSGAIVSLAALGAVAALIRGSYTFHMAIFVMCIPGMLYCVDWLVRSRTSQQARPNQNISFRPN